MVTIIDVIWRQLDDNCRCKFDHENRDESTESGPDFSRDRGAGHPRPVRDPSPRTADYSQ